MALKDIMVFVDPTLEGDRRLRLAAELSRRHAAHLIGVYVVSERLDRDPADAYTRGEKAIQSVIRRYRVAEEHAAIDAGRRFTDLVMKHDVAAEFRVVRTNDASRNIVLNSLHADLVVVGHNAPHGLPQDWLPEHVLLASGVPVLVVPNDWQTDAIGERIVIAWNASKEARRAVADALPLLTKAKFVTVLVVDPGKSGQRHGEEPGVDIARHLARHGVPVEVEQVASGGIPIADVILSHATKRAADLLAIGAYSHARSAEIVLGGVTRTILKQMALPVLISR